MLELATPWVLALAPLPLLAWWLLPPYRERRAAVRIPAFEQISEAAGTEARRGAVVLQRTRLQKGLLPLVWGLALFALATPQWVEPPIERTESARDLLLAVDLSGSMSTRDFVDPTGERVTRLEAVRAVLDDFVRRREGDRLGLVVFGDAAHLMAPFTADHGLFRELLGRAELGIVGQQTMIGDAIGLAIRLFDASEAERKVVVLLTDGNDTGSRVPPHTAAGIASDHEVVVHTVAVGDPAATGEDRVDLAALEDIAKRTGGRSFFADDRQGLEEIYRTLDSVEPRDVETLSYRPRRSLVHWPLGAVAALGGLHGALMLAWTGRRRALPS